MKRRIYLDYNATAPMPPEVQTAMARCCGEAWGNPGSDHAEGRRAKAAVEVARMQVANLIGAFPEEVVFTSGGTEADNTVILGLGGGSMLCSAVEHKAVLEPAADLAGHGPRFRGVRSLARKVAVLPNGRLDADDFAAKLQQYQPALVSVMLANNEVGNVYPLAVVGRMAREANPQVLVHSDAVNALGKIPIHVGRLGLDLASFSAHKIGGPKGVGALYVRNGVRVPPMLQGGGQEHGIRSGTLNVPAIRGFGVAAKLAQARLAQGESGRLAHARDIFEAVIGGAVPGVRIVGDRSRRLPNTTSLSFVGALPEFQPQAFVQALDRYGVAASAGSACTCQTDTPSHVLEAMGVEGGAVRFSFGWDTDEDDAVEAAHRVLTVIERMS